MNNKAFFKEFGFGEFKAILNEGTVKIIILFFLLFVSFLAIGIGNGSKEFLDIKMSDPFIKFIDITVPHSAVQHKEKITSVKLKDWGEEFKFQGPFPMVFDDVKFGYTGWHRSGLYKSNDSIKPDEAFKVSIIEEDDVFFNDIKKYADHKDFSRLWSKDIAFPKEDFGCIVTTGMLDKLGLNPALFKGKNLYSDPYYIEYFYKHGEVDIYVPLRIMGVVKELRSKVDVLISKYAYCALLSMKDFNLHRSNPKYLRYFVYESDIAQFSQNSSFDLLKNRGFQRVELFKDRNSGIIAVTDNINLDDDLNLINEFKKNHPDVNLLRIFDIKNYYASGATLCGPGQKKLPKNDVLTVVLDSLDTAEPLADALESTYGIELNRTDIENKKNFSFFNKLITILSSSLIFFSIVSIIFFITNLLLSHIENNKKSLGTLKAFGLPSSSIVFVYSLISFGIVALCFLLSYCFSEFLGPLFLDQMSKLLDDSSGYLTLVEFSAKPLWENLFYFIIVPTVCVCVQIYRYLYNVTPGDLIYNRKQ